jgi:hypothetical protein
MNRCSGKIIMVCKDGGVDLEEASIMFVCWIVSQKKVCVLIYGQKKCLLMNENILLKACYVRCIVLLVTKNGRDHEDFLRIFSEKLEKK